MIEAILNEKGNEHISHYLLFENDNINDLSTRETAIIKSGSKIHRINDRKGMHFQLFLNEKEYKNIRNNFINNKKYLIHFYGDNYIYLPPGCHLIIPLAKFLDCENKDKKTWFDPYKFMY